MKNENDPTPENCDLDEFDDFLENLGNSPVAPQNPLPPPKPLACIPEDLEFHLAGETLRDYIEPGVKDADIALHVGYLKNRIPASGAIDQEAHDLLLLQSRILNVLFNKTLQYASLNQNRSLDIEKIGSALLSQRQCRQALDSLGRIRIRQDRANKLKDRKNVW